MVYGLYRAFLHTLLLEDNDFVLMVTITDWNLDETPQ